MAKPIGAACNLRCQYCYYLEKTDAVNGGCSGAMEGSLLERYIRQYLESQPGDVVNFAWQGGEPTLLGLDFFRRVVELQRRFADGRRVTNAIQTNGTRLDADWGQFLRDQDFLVGISMDGPRALHDRYRVTIDHKGSFDAVMRGLAVLQEFQVRYNTLTVVNRANFRKPLEVYRFLVGAGAQHLQFIPLVERKASEVQRESGLRLGPPGSRRADTMAWSVPSAGFGEFLCRIFDIWWKNDVGKIFVQHFDSALNSWLGMEAGLCSYAPTCGRGLALESDGSMYSCDHYVYPEYRLGNIKDSHLAEMATGESQRKFGLTKRETLARQCQQCDWLFACSGDCPKHRFATTAQGEPVSYLCPSLRRFFRHINLPMKEMAGSIRMRQGMS